MRRFLLGVLFAVSAFGGGFFFDRWLHRPVIVHVSSVDLGHTLPEPNAFGPLKPQGAEDGVCGAFDTPDNFCQAET